MRLISEFEFEQRMKAVPIIAKTIICEGLGQTCPPERRAIVTRELLTRRPHILGTLAAANNTDAAVNLVRRELNELYEADPFLCEIGVTPRDVAFGWARIARPHHDLETLRAEIWRADAEALAAEVYKAKWRILERDGEAALQRARRKIEGRTA